MVDSNALLAGVGLALLRNKVFPMLLNFPKCCQVDMFSLFKKTPGGLYQDPKDGSSSPGSSKEESYKFPGRSALLIHKDWPWEG